MGMSAWQCSSGDFCRSKCVGLRHHWISGPLGLVKCAYCVGASVGLSETFDWFGRRYATFGVASQRDLGSCLEFYT